MDQLNLTLIFALLLLGVVVRSHAATIHPSEVYWQNVLPNTPMPKAVRDLLRHDIVEEIMTNVDVGKSTGHNKGKPAVTVKVMHPTGPVFLSYGTSGTHQLEDDPTATPFFLEKDLHPGTKITNLHFLKTSINDDEAATFLPQNVAAFQKKTFLPQKKTFLPQNLANQIPFSSNKFPQILNTFSIDPKSEGAKAIKETIEECEEPTIAKEVKYCATSLESMIKFSTSNLGKNVNVLPTEIIHNKEKFTQNKQQNYIIKSGVKKMGGGNSVVCHAQTYLYAVFYCHVTHTRAYVVPMVGEDNATKIKVVAVCHTDTSKWNPKHMAFKILKVKPGTVPICHFLSKDNIVWVAKNYSYH